MLQRDDRPGSLGRPSLFSEAPGAPVEDKNILKQLDGALAASARVTSGTLRKRGIVGGLLALCAVVAGLVWTSGQDSSAPAVVRTEAFAPPQVAAPAAPVPTPAPALPAVPAPSSAAAPPALLDAGVTASPRTGAASVTPKSITQPRTAGQPRARSHRHAARTVRGKPAAATERRGHKATAKAKPHARQAAGTHANVRGKDTSVAHAERRSAGRHKDARVGKAGKRGTRDKTRGDSDAALLEAVLAHGRVTGAATGKVPAAAGHCDPVKGSGADRGHHSTLCSTHIARNKSE